jgi:Ca2+-binding EF-hand superfamily protein
MNRAERTRFTMAARGRDALTPEEFGALYVQLGQARVDDQFRKADWNRDGKLSLDEYVAPIRARFLAFEDVPGAESCANAHVFRAAPTPRVSGRGRFCDAHDLNRDGRVTRGELDTVTARRFTQRSGGAKVMTSAQYRAEAGELERRFAAGAFRSLDADRNGKLSYGEFAASDTKLFARLDANRDGIVARDELSRAALRPGPGAGTPSFAP